MLGKSGAFNGMGAGASFMAELAPQGLACFIVTFLAVATLGRGLLAAGHLTVPICGTPPGAT